MYESKSHRLLSTGQFLRRLGVHAAAAGVLVLGSIVIGMIGYEYFEHLAWRDAFLNATMLLGGMGPVDPPHSDGGKLFAGFYALYAGLVFVVVAGLMVAPFAHRLLHRFHVDVSK